MSGIRARVRAELTEEIKTIARRQMAAEGASALSLRAIARELGMVSSAIYRYYASRDDLLTALIIDAYNDLGAAGEAANASVATDKIVERWVAVSHSAFTFAKERPAEYSLLFGTPIPGYAAPDDTIGPASRFTLVLLGILDEASRQNARPQSAVRIPRALRADLARLRTIGGAKADDRMLVAGLQVWTALFGAISFILFGQLNNVISDVDALFDTFVLTLAHQVFGIEDVPRQP